MDVQTFYYLIGSIFMVLAVTLIVGLGVVFFMIYRRMQKVQKKIEASPLGRVAQKVTEPTTVKTIMTAVPLAQLGWKIYRSLRSSKKKA